MDHCLDFLTQISRTGPINIRQPAEYQTANRVGRVDIAVALPVRVFLEEEVERWLEIRDTGGRLITVLQVLSPSNKLESAERDQYRRKRQSFISAGVNLVEIDLVRQGTTVFPETIRRVLREAGAGYGVCVFRAAQPVAYEVYPMRLRDRLPVIRVPLRSTDADVVLDLQPLINQCHERGRYHLFTTLRFA